MRVIARTAWNDLNWGTPLARALAQGELPAPFGKRAAQGFERDGASASFVAALRAERPAPVHGDWTVLGDPGVRVVVTGQQPGCAGGPLLVLYKAATAVALARNLSRRLDRTVVPVFWNGTDDEDFDEIATVGWPEAGALAYLQLPAGGRRVGGWVGDLPAAGDGAAVAAARVLCNDRERAALDQQVPQGAADHGSWVGAWLATVFPELRVLDARSSALRVHGAELFGRYLEQRSEVDAALRSGVAAVRAAGFETTLDPQSLRHALYLTPDRRREKLGDDDVEPLRRALAARPETVSPNVVLRPLLQDTLLPTIAHVVGPAEIGYLVELRPVRAVLGTPEPELVPRLTQTVLPEGVAQAARDAGLALDALLLDPASALLERARERAAAPRAALAASFAALPGALEGLPLSDSARTRAMRRLAALEESLAGELDAAARDALVAERPSLTPLASWMRPRGRSQERLLAGLWLAASWGADTGALLVELAESHLDALARGKPEHALVTV